MRMFFFDAETNGLYGGFLSIAAVVTDEKGSELAVFYGALRNPEKYITEEWVKENVLPWLSDADRFFDSEQELCEAFWEFWMCSRKDAEKHSEELLCIADVQYPVEARLMEKCVRVNEPERRCNGPYPLYDLSTLLKSKGLDPMTDRNKLANLPGMNAHDAMCDVRMAVKIWRELLHLGMPYSYHTFFMPFRLAEGITREKFTSFLSDDVWESSQRSEKDKFSGPDIVDCDDARLLYNEYAYFNEPARNAVYSSSDEEVVMNYTFMPEDIRCRAGEGKAKYCITKKIKLDGIVCSVEYRLDLNAIKLKLYNTGIGILIFECEYRGDRSIDGKQDRSCTIDDVRRINEYGRRIAPPFLPKDDERFGLSADSLGVILNNGERLITDMHGLKVKNQLHLSRQPKKEIIDVMGNVNYIAGFIGMLLTYDRCSGKEQPVECGEKSRAEKADDIFKIIRLCIDDRMLVACLVRDDAFVPRMRYGSDNWPRVHELEQKYYKKKLSEKEKAEYNSIKSSTLTKFAYEIAGSKEADELYALIAIDGEDSSCQSANMTQDLLGGFVYPRWRNWGTLHAVSHHSLMCMTGEDPSIESSVINPFLMHYQQMFCLTIAQRASIIALSDRASVLSKSFSRSTRSIGQKDTRKLIDLQERYIAFQNQLLLFEVTPQEQGVELYKMMQESLYVDKENERLERQLQNLYEATNISHDANLNDYGFIFAVIALLFTLVQFVPVLVTCFVSESAERNPDVITGIITALLLAVIIGVALILWRTNERKDRE